MSKSAKIALLLATLWPVVYMLIFFGAVISMLVLMPRQGELADGQLPVWFTAILVLHFLTIFWILALTIFYIVNVFRNARVEQDKKVLWAVVLFFANILAMPIYWYLYIWREPAA